MDDKLTSMGHILDRVVENRDIASKLTKLLNGNPAEEYPIPAEALVIFIELLEENTKTISTLFEQNQTLMDANEKLLAKNPAG